MLSKKSFGVFTKLVLLIALAITLYSFAPQYAVADGSGLPDPLVHLDSPDTTPPADPILPGDPGEDEEISLLLKLFLITL
jgi:hypothetical protein